MIDKYALRQIEDLTDRFTLKNGVPRGVKRNHTITPTQQAPVVTLDDTSRTMKLMTWGLLPANAKNTNSIFRYKTFNTKSETAFNKHSTAKAIRTRRCLIPANGFYIQQSTGDGKQGFYVQPKDKALCAFAGIYSSSQNGSDETIHCFSILTTTANKELHTIAPRMPVIIPPDAESDWLNPSIDDTATIYRLMQPSDDAAFDIRRTDK